MAQIELMHSQRTVPGHWISELARADNDLAHGDLVPAYVIHLELEAALAGLEAEAEARDADVQ